MHGNHPSGKSYVLAVLFMMIPLAFAQEIERSALDQIGQLIAEKQSRTPAERKMDSNLLYWQKIETGNPALNRLPKFKPNQLNRNTEGVLVDIHAEFGEITLAAIQQLGGKIINDHQQFNAIRARLPLEALTALAQRSEVISIRAADTMMLQVETEGDVAHQTDVVRTNFGVTGAGLKVGAISDSVDALADLQATNELPANVTVLPGQSGNPGSSEGTALLEIIHDMAPDAELFFATAAGGQAQFAQNILDLAAAGCEIIVDDAQYFGEGAFQDDLVAQAVETFVSQGGLYITAAGNAGNLKSGQSGVWEGDFVATVLPTRMEGMDLTVHDFGGGLNNNEVTQDSPFFFTLQWSDPLNGSENDYDLLLLDASLTNVIAASTNTQNGTQDPFETIDTLGRDDTGARLVVVLTNGVPRHLHLNANRGRLSEGTNGQIYGHPGAVGAVAVGAVNVATAGGGPFVGGAANPIEVFSSDGPRRIFFNADGTPVSGSAAVLQGGQTSIVRQKPDISAADGVTTSTPGFNPFFGTSASAPHVAGISALIKELHSTTSIDGDIRDFMFSTALDIEDPGFDNTSGHGIVSGLGMAEDPIFSDGFESGDASSWTK